MRNFEKFMIGKQGYSTDECFIQIQLLILDHCSHRMLQKRKIFTIYVDE